MFCMPEIIFGVIDGVGFGFHVLHSRTRFPRYRGRRVPFSCIALRDYFWAVPRAPCAIELEESKSVKPIDFYINLHPAVALPDSF
jgi:hypothetical protein